MDPSAERLAADFPGWRIEVHAGGTRYYSAHRDGEHLGSPTAAGLRRLLADREPVTVTDLGRGLSQAGF